MMAKKITRYACENCDEEYDSKEDADSCCKKKGNTCGDPVVELF